LAKFRPLPRKEARIMPFERTDTGPIDLIENLAIPLSQQSPVNNGKAYEAKIMLEKKALVNFAHLV